ncbi:VOC family protein [Sphingomonas sp. 2R-10]|uniref:2-oxoadipate dioxygenase/decarboxylase HglS n=1 Tax=Sphingomonas sp. 2R-10 TaxID=3045148 RepID=UPI0019D09A17|nr:VOC family protein [Sphingomonas sp. 2R-10]MDJ0275503.1 VOC family protein [Sphingomonas sp. 2R-10]
MTDFIPSDAIRTRFSEAMSAMYRAEVPLYGDLLSIVVEVNERTLTERPDVAADLAAAGELDRLDVERHGAIRVGTPAELAMLRRAFAVMGMHPVGYYDLSVAGVPVHSTAFRPIDAAALTANPFRVFTSLLRLELIGDDALRAEAEAILSTRRIFTDDAIRLIERAEAEGGLDDGAADRFVAGLLETFRWHGDARVDAAGYARLNGAHRLIADIVAFRGPHINHLTPRTLDIDAAQAEMERRGIDAKAVIEGPPPRAVPILLRQTSFKAIEEGVTFPGDQPGQHTARFGEIEQRGAALTPKGRALYDRLLAQARQGSGDYAARLADAFADFPDTIDALREQGLAYFRYKAIGAAPRTGDLTDWIAAGRVRAVPLVYEDFLPVSAAGIFQSNLGGATQRSYGAAAAQAAFEAALGAPVQDELALYAATEARSIAALRTHLRDAA